MAPVPTGPWPEVPGFVVLAGAAGADAGGNDPDVAPAVQEGTRRRALLRRLPELSESDRERMAAVLTAVDAVDCDDLGGRARLHPDRDVMVLPSPARTLADDRLAPRSTGQLVTAVVPVASALAALHEAGLAHGALTERVVEVDDDGHPRLLDAGEQAALHALAPREVAEPTPDADLAALRLMALRLAERVNDPTPAEVLTAPENVGASAREVAALLLDLAEPQPLDQGGGTSSRQAPVEAGEMSSGRRRQRGVLVLVTAMVLVAAGVTWWVSRPDDASAPSAGRTSLPQPIDPVGSRTTTSGATPTPDAAPTGGSTPTAASAGQTPAPSAQASGAAEGELAAETGVALCGAPPPAPDSAPPRPDDWADVIAALYVRRSAALVTGQTSLLCEVYDPLSPGLADDIALDAAYREQQLRPDGLDFVVESAEQLEREGALVLVEVTDRLEPYVLLGPDGDVAAELPGLASGTWQARLVPDASGTQWRFG
jgi:hypothetical protein